MLARGLRDEGFEVVYTGLRQTPEMIVTAALQEDVDVVGLSILSGAHMTLCPRITALLKAEGLDDVLVTAGGIIPDDDMPPSRGSAWPRSSAPARPSPGRGVLPRQRPVARRRRDRPPIAGDDLAERALAGDRRALARLLTEVENRTPAAEAALRRLYPLAGRAHLVGVTGAAGSGQVHARRGAHRRGSRGRPTGGRHRHRSLQPDHRWRDPGRPGPDAGVRRRP